MANLYRLESDSPAIFGLAVTFNPALPAIKTQWTHRAPLIDSDCLQLAKDCAAHTLKRLIETGRGDEANATNWASITAAMQRHIADINEMVKARVYAAGESVEMVRAEIEGGGVAGGERIH